MSVRYDGVLSGRSVRLLSASAGAVLIACLHLIGCGAGNGDARADVPPVEVARLTEHRPPVVTTVASGDTLETVSRRIAGRDWVAWRDALAAEIDPRKLRPGTVFEGVRSPSGVL